MIEKLDTVKDIDNVFDRNGLITTVPNGVAVINKINELVDVVNSIASVQEKLIDSRFVVETKHEETADKFAFQRRWIGKLCKFWDEDDEYYLYEILIDIDDSYYNEDYPYKIKKDASFKHCEPVSEDLIYKKENEYTYQEIIIGDMHENKGE